LESTGHVKLEKGGRERVAFPQGVPATHRRWLLAMRTFEAREVLRALLDDPGQSVPALSRRLDRSGKVIRGAIAALVRAGILYKVGWWRPVYALKLSDAGQMASLLRKPAVGAWEWEPGSGRSTMSEGGWRVLGVAPEPGRTCQAFVAAFVHPEDRLELKSVVGAAMAEGLPYDHTVRLRTPLGERHVRQRGWVVARHPDGKVLRYGGTLEDVTDFVKAGRRGNPVPKQQPWNLPEQAGSKPKLHRRPAGGLREAWAWVRLALRRGRATNL
jgi:PAS domain-containing protein